VRIRPARPSSTSRISSSDKVRAHVISSATAKSDVSDLPLMYRPEMPFDERVLPLLTGKTPVAVRTNMLEMPSLHMSTQSVLGVTILLDAVAQPL